MMGGSMVFSFGDPEPVLKDHMADFLGVFPDLMFGFYIPPIYLMGLAKAMNANAQHNAILRFKRNMLVKWLLPSPILSYSDAKKAALDYHVFGMCYFRKILNRFGQILRIERRPALMMRAGVDEDVYFEMRDYRYMNAPLKYQPGEVFIIMEDDVKQEIYGIPEYFGGLQSVLLSEDATLFRRKYFRNGSHAGYILVTSDAGINDETAKMIEEQVKLSRGPGNFRNLYINIPRTSSREPVKIIPIGDIGTKDDFQAIKDITKAETLAMHRMQPGIAGVIPENTAGFGDLEKVMRVYVELEVPPMQRAFQGINDHLPRDQWIEFAEPIWNAVARKLHYENKLSLL
jgi:PBSX family phage portal protein